MLKAAYPKVVATLSRVFGDLDLAEDATQDAMLKALNHWRSKGLPNEPVAWLVTVARNGAIDQMRKTARAQPLGDNVVYLQSTEPTPDILADTEHLSDDLLRLIYTCCHPSLTEETQILLTLKVVLGFSVPEVAAALLSSRTSVERRVSRAKRKLEAESDGFQVPPISAIPERSDAVLRVVYLLFNHGYSRYGQPEVYQERLMDQAIRLARMVVRSFRDHPEAKALLALMLLISARAPARLDTAGCFVPLVEQDRTRWDWSRIREGRAVVDAVLAARHPPGAYQIQAAIAALHNVERADVTDWQQIAGLYERLTKYDHSPVVPVNRAVAIAMAGDDLGAHRLLSALVSEPRLQAYQPFHAALAFVFERLGRRKDAQRCYEQAVDLCESAPERAYLMQRLAAL